MILLNIYGYTLEDIENYLEKIGEKKFHAKQIYRWLYDKRVNSFDLMTDLRKEVIDKLKEDFSMDFIKIVRVEKSEKVRKYLFELEDHEHVEAVLMLHDYGRSVCISSQVGCNMGCKFCESGRRRKVRNLEAYEMVEQILLIEEEFGQSISHVVVMGIGEPFDNFDNLIRFLKIINSNFGLSIGARHITVSTCGIIPKIEEFSNLEIQINLAISLHAPNDEIRNKIMPINKVYRVKDLMKAIKNYYDKTNRRVTIEYIMLDGINDSNECALELAKLLSNLNCYVNLIPYNETENIGFKRSKMIQINRFYDILKKNNINVTIRREFGGSISAACGQLRSKEEDI
ncbi:MAG: 23S rRNA (adenine(2503)-C(2))-methyltransferase RlmN [Bacilli bacterium]|nr:23S rRNA (adenine(2503)-C(2))-methyltransferase RlmN [Bacilli bacterium]